MLYSNNWNVKAMQNENYFDQLIKNNIDLLQNTLYY